MSNLLEFLIPDSTVRQAEASRARFRVHVTERLLIEMEAAGTTKAQLAEKVGVTRAAVTQALSGSRNMTLNAVHDFAVALGLEPTVDFVKCAVTTPSVVHMATGSQLQIVLSGGNAAPLTIPDLQLHRTAAATGFLQQSVNRQSVAMESREAK